MKKIKNIALILSILTLFAGTQLMAQDSSNATSTAPPSNSASSANNSSTSSTVTNSTAVTADAPAQPNMGEYIAIGAVVLLALGLVAYYMMRNKGGNGTVVQSSTTTTQFRRNGPEPDNSGDSINNPASGI